MEWWSCIDIKLYGRKEDYDILGKESAICLSNHRSDIDWLIGYVIADRAGVLSVRKIYITTITLGSYSALHCVLLAGKS